ncbi:hypothetical protein JHK84_032098 [Glycine max]|nr:hypothetical protein JHK84_032098 [Glycine max]
MTLPSPTTLHHQTTIHFSTTFISTLTKLFSQSDYHHVSRFIHCLKQDAIEIPDFYQRQWLPNYPEIVEFKYDGETYEIQVRQHKGKLYFADGLTRLRTEL